MKIDWKEIGKQATQHIGYNLLVLLCGALAIAFLVMTVLSAFSVGRGEGIVVKETFDVSSAPLDAENKHFISQIGGYLINYEDQQAQLDCIIVEVGNGRERFRVEIDGVVLHPRLAEEIRYEWEADFDFDRVHSVTVVIEGEQILLSNSPADAGINPNILLFGLLCAISSFATVFTFKKRYYRYQEDLMAVCSTEEETE